MARKWLGSLKATKKASAIGPAPRIAAMTTSRMKPVRRETSVSPPTVAMRLIILCWKPGERRYDATEPPPRPSPLRREGKLANGDKLLTQQGGPVYAAAWTPGNPRRGMAKHDLRGGRQCEDAAFSGATPPKAFRCLAASFLALSS